MESFCALTEQLIRYLEAVTTLVTRIKFNEKHGVFYLLIGLGEVFSTILTTNHKAHTRGVIVIR